MLLRKRVRLPRLGLSGLDLKLGVRMLVRYPVLTLVGSGSLALAIAIGPTVFAFISLMLWPRLPLPDGDQVVIVQHYDRAANTPESRVVADFLRWRGGTGTLGDLAAGRGRARNITHGRRHRRTHLGRRSHRLDVRDDARRADPRANADRCRCERGGAAGPRDRRADLARAIRGGSRPPGRAGARQRRADGRGGRDAGGVQVSVGLRGVAAAQDRRRRR